MGRTMRGFLGGAWMQRALWAVVLALPMGCQQNSLWSLLPDETSPAEYPLQLSEGAKKDRDLVVGVFVSCSGVVGPAFATCDEKLASEITQKLPRLAQESSHPTRLNVLNTFQINKFKLNTPNWQKLRPVEWGQALGADFILNVRIDALSLYRPGAVNKLYDGLAEASVDVYDVQASPQPRYHYICLLRYPNGEPIDSTQVPEHRFKQSLLEMLALEICLKHVR
jgi:hypothetical protein